MNNGISKLFDSEKAKYEQQRIRQRKITRLIAAFLLPIFLGIGVVSFFSLFKALSRQTFFNVSASILAYSLLSGFFEYIKTKTDGPKKAVLFMIIQLILFVLVSILMISLLKK
jgi:hypothetical protein